MYKFPQQIITMVICMSFFSLSYADEIEKEEKPLKFDDSEIILKTLEIAEAIGQGNTLTLSMIKEYTEIDMNPQEEQDYYQYTGEVNHQWLFLYELLMKSPRSLTFSFLPKDQDNTSTDFSSICSINANIIEDRLLTMNLRKKGQDYSAPANSTYEYSNDRMSVTLNLAPSTLNKTNPPCVSAIKIMLQ